MKNYRGRWKSRKQLSRQSKTVGSYFDKKSFIINIKQSEEKNEKTTIRVLIKAKNRFGSSVDYDKHKL